jgi:hypothetical protein
VTRRLEPPSADVVDELRRIAERRLSADEFEAYVGAPMSDDERREVIDLIDWFMRRYPTPAARLAQARRSYEASESLMPHATRRRFRFR